ncbi:MAG: methylenetetrahydrofolate reductase [Deltaproteobacteria bacterium]|jgi:methylenetetrahydrofolate reductase (NADPH)|nr:methylenetetrahydrofolate reductase [Deltaproteobacteria bacterium]
MSTTKTFSEIFATHKKTISFEFFPAKSAQQQLAAQATILELIKFNPDFISVTHSTVQNALELKLTTLEFIKKNIPDLITVAHLTALNHNLQDINLILEHLKQLQISHIVALRGDEQLQAKSAAFNYASELVTHLKQVGGFSVAVAGYPEGHYQAVSLEADLEFLKQKIDSGAELIITQFFLDSKLFFRFLEKTKKAGITTPILPGIILLDDLALLQSLAQKCKVSLPPKLFNQLEKVKDNKADFAQASADFITQMCNELLAGGAVGLHFFTLNKAEPTKTIIKNLVQSL